MKVMISQPMNGVLASEIRKTQDFLKEEFGKYNIDVVDSFLTEVPGTEIKNPDLFYLGRTIQNFLSDVDAVYFCTGWERARGCRIERHICEEYGIPILDSSFFKVAEGVYCNTKEFIRCLNFNCNLGEAILYMVEANCVSYNYGKCVRNLKLASNYLFIEEDIVLHRILDNGDSACPKKTFLSREDVNRIASKCISYWLLSDELTSALMRLIECQFATSYSDYLENIKWAVKHINKGITNSEFKERKTK